MLFQNPKDKDNTAIRQAIRTWLIAHKQLPANTVISIAEVKCCGEQCPHIVTIISIFYDDAPTEIIRITKPLVYVRKHDLITLP